MSRPILKLPKNSIKPAVAVKTEMASPAGAAALPYDVRASTAAGRAPAESLHFAAVGMRAVSLVPTVWYVESSESDSSKSNEFSSDFQGLLERASDPRARFCPTVCEFKQTAKRLVQITCAGLSKAQDTLARIYGYAGFREFKLQAAVSCHIGPYDDEHTDFWESSEGKELAAKRLSHTVAMIVADCPWLVVNSPGPAPYFIDGLKLFSRAGTQEEAFRNLNIRKLSSQERTDVRTLEL